MWVKKIYKIGGAHSIAALAYGTKKIEKVVNKFEENEKLVYNLSTDGTNTYIANNYVVHNKCDIRLKKNIRFLKWFMGQNIYTWEWNELAAELGIMGPTKGFIAQEVLKTRPDAVVLDDDGYYSVDFRKLGLIK